MKIWDRLDEVIGSGLLAGMGIYAMRLGVYETVAGACVTGIIALLAVKAVKGNNGGE